MFIAETAGSRSATAAFEGSSGKLNWTIQLEGAETETDAHDYIVANAPTTFIPATGVVYQYQSYAITKHDAGSDIIEVEIVYSQTKPLQFTFQTGGGSEKVDYSRDSIHHYSAAGKNLGDVPDFSQGINVTKTSIEGVTIRTANFQFKLTKSWAKGQTIHAKGAFAGRAAHDAAATGYRYLSTDGNGTDTEPPTRAPILYVHGVGAGVWAAMTHVAGEVDGQYIRDVERMTSKFNLYAVTLIIDGIWLHFLPGELFFEGTDGGRTIDKRFELTYAFAVSRNIDADPANPADPEGRMVGTIYISEKRGWDLIWIYSEETTDAGFLVRTPKAAYVERVYDFDDFAKLRLDE